MDRLWLLHLLLCTALYHLDLTVCTPLDDPDATGFKFGDDIYPDNVFGVIPSKRLSKFVRIGRGLSSFIRIGRGQPKIYGFDNDAMDDLGDSTFDDDVVDNSAFDTSSDFQLPKRRLSSFVRIGRGGDFPEPETDSIDGEFQKRGGAFIRMGKFPSSALLRHRGGMIQSIARQPYYRRSGRIGQSSFIRIGKRDTTEALERMEKQHVRNPASEYRRYLRIGKDLEGENADMDNGFEKPQEKRLSNFVRIGRGPAVRGDDLYKHYVGYEGVPVQDKRMSKFVRIGKNAQNADKRFSKFVRIGKANLEGNEAMDKRMSKFVRIGKDIETLGSDINKRLSSFVRIGKSDQDAQDNLEKRLSSFVRIGKNIDLHNPDEATGDEFVEAPGENKELDNYKGIIGEVVDPAKAEVIDKRALSRFVRIGKSGIESGADTPADWSSADKRLSSFVRIGRSTENKQAATEADMNESKQ